MSSQVAVLVFIACLLASVASTTDIIVPFALTCSNGPFMFTITLIERDGVDGDDEVAKFSAKANGEYSGIIRGVQHEDWGLEFELSLEVEHNCPGPDIIQRKWVTEKPCTKRVRECIFSQVKIELIPA